jgi:hypothetical protein
VCKKPLFVGESEEIDSRKATGLTRINIERGVFDAFVRGVRSGDILQASMTFIDNVESVSEDVPVRDREWFRAHPCPPPNITDPSPAYALPDWQFALLDDGPSANFKINLKKVIESAVVSLNLQKSMPDTVLTKASRKAAFHDVAWNPYVIYASNMQDAEQFPLEGNEQYFAWLYLVRSKIGLNGDYGFKTQVTFVGEGPIPFLDGVKDLFNMGVKFGESGQLFDVIGGAVSKVWDAVSGIMSLITDVFKGFMDRIKSFLISSMLRFFDLDKVAYVTKNIFNAVVYKATIVYSILFFIGSNVISYHVTKFLIEQVQTRFVGEAELSPAALVSTLAAAVFGLSTDQEDKVLKRARYICALMAGGTVLANLGACAFTLFPSVIQDSIAWKFGTEEYRLKYLAGNWRAASNAILQFSTVPRVVASQYFYDQIQERLREGNELLDQLNSVKYSGLRSCPRYLFEIAENSHSIESV